MAEIEESVPISGLVIPPLRPKSDADPLATVSEHAQKADVAGLDITDHTAHVINTSSNISDDRVKFLFSRLIQHCHDYVREVALQKGEWEASWTFLTKVGQVCDHERQEFILLADILGISALVDTLNSKQLPGCTESSILGPFHNESEMFEHGQTISSVGAGEPMLIRGSVKNRAGEPIDGALFDIWETNGNGMYDIQDPESGGADCRGKFYSDKEGKFFINGVHPVDYPVPFDGPVGVILDLLNRQAYRPAHVHFLIEHRDYEKINTALYDSTSPRLHEDPVFGTKSSLVNEIEWVEDESMAQEYNTQLLTKDVNGELRKGFWLMEYDFILAEKQERKILKTSP